MGSDSVREVAFILSPLYVRFYILHRRWIAGLVKFPPTKNTPVKAKDTSVVWSWGRSLLNTLQQSGGGGAAPPFKLSFTASRTLCAVYISGLPELLSKL